MCLCQSAPTYKLFLIAPPYWFSTEADVQETMISLQLEGTTFYEPKSTTQLTTGYKKGPFKTPIKANKKESPL